MCIVSLILYGPGRLTMPRGTAAYLCGLGVEELLHVLDAKVADTNVLDLARVQQLLHLAPRVDKVPVGVGLARVRVGAARPVDQVQVDVVGLKGGQRLLKGLGHALVPGVVQFGRQPDVGPRDP